MQDNLPKNLDEVSTLPPSENVGQKIIMFGTPPCPDCARVKKFLAENAIEYEYHDLATDKEGLSWISTFVDHVPVLIMLDKTIMYSPSNEELLEKIQGSSVNKKVTPIEPEKFDIIIIGGGPAGITAAIYAVRKSLKVLLIAKEVGGQAARSGDVENYPGFTMITGVDLASKFREEVNRFQGEGLWIKEGVVAKLISGEENNFTVETDTSKYQGKTVIVATGREPKMLNIPGEKEFFGKGVATCATCDAPLYKGKEVAVIGGGNSALDAAFSLLKIAKSVTVVNISESLVGDEVLKNNVTQSSKVTVLNDSTAVEIQGDSFVTGVKVQNTKTHEEKVIPVDGVFIEIGWTPAVDLVPQLAKDKHNQIVVDEYGKSSVAGIWAAGDVNNLWGEQIVIAAGEGAKVALSVAEHVSRIPHQATSNIHEG